MSENELPIGSKLNERVMRLLTRIEYRQMNTVEEREEIYRLRYRSYLREGAIQANDAKHLWDKFDDIPNACVLGIYIDRRLAGSIRIHVINAQHHTSPALDAFPNELARELEAGRTIIDSNRFVAEHDVARVFPELPYITLRVAFMAAAHFYAAIATATVRAEHQSFYQRVLRYRSVCEPRPYPTLIKPLGLMMVDFEAEKHGVLDRYPFFGSLASERTAVFIPQS